jgi:hypothetical protein
MDVCDFSEDMYHKIAITNNLKKIKAEQLRNVTQVAANKHFT